VPERMKVRPFRLPAVVGTSTWVPEEVTRSCDPLPWVAFRAIDITCSTSPKEALRSMRTVTRAWRLSGSTDLQ
jgi:hypothetical protein